MARRPSIRDKFAKNKMLEKTQESHARRDSGGDFKTFFDQEKTSTFQTWWAAKGDHIIDIIPYEAGTQDPRNKPGEPVYVLDIEVHRNVGPMEEMIVCLEQYKKPCPICEEGRRLNKEGKDYKKYVKPLKPSRRALYNIRVRENEEAAKKGNLVFEIAHWFMEKHISKIAKDPRGNGFVVFCDPDEGKSISFERTGTGAENTGYAGHRFVDRPEPISNEELEEVVCLDEIIKIHTYDEICDIFYGSSPKDSSKDDERDEEKYSGKDDEGDEEKDEMDDERDEQDQPDDPPPQTEKLNRRSRREPKVPTCPHGGVIGEDIDELKECEECKVYNQCADIADGI